MDDTIEDLSIIVNMMRNKINLKIIEKRSIDLIKHLEKTKREEKDKSEELNMNNITSIKKRNDILQSQILDADSTINTLYKQIDELNIEKQDLKKMNIFLVNEKQNLEKFYSKTEKKQTVEKATGTELFTITQSKEQELKNKIKELEKDIATFDKKINDYDLYFDEFEKYHYKISYPIPKRCTLDEEIDYINMSEKKRCCFL